MASISSVGIGSGVLTSDLIDKLASAESGPTTLRLDAKETKISAQLSDMGLIKSTLSDLRIAARVLKNPEVLQGRTASSSNSAVSISAENGSALGTHTIDVNQLAEAHVLSTNFSLTDTDETAIGTGTLSISDGTNTETISITNENNTLDGIAAAINSVSGLGVTATVLNTTGSDYKLVLTANETGIENSITLAVADDGDGDSADDNGLSRLLNANLLENNPPEDANFSFNNIDITRSTNVITDVLPNTTLTLNGETTSQGIITISQDTSSAADRVQDFVDKYNEFKTLVNETTNYDPESREAGTLLGNASLSLVDRQIKNLFGSVVTGMANASVRSLTELGIQTASQTGLLSFNASTFNTVLSSVEDDVAALLGEDGRATDSQLSFVSASEAAEAGTYDIEVTRMATQGQYVANVDLSSGLTIDADNDTFRISVDGVTSGIITLTQNSYATGNDLVQELQTQINADTTLNQNALSVNVALDANNFLTFTSNSYGSDSSVSLSDLDVSTAASFGLNASYVGDIDIETSGVTIDASNDTFKINVDGTDSNTITLTQGAYTGASIAAEIQAQINADSILSAASKSVNVSVDANNFLRITSNSNDTNSAISIVELDDDSETEIGLAVRSSNSGLDVAGTINGEEASGVRQRLTGASGSDANGISIDIIAGGIGDRGSVTYVKGVANDLVDMINGFLGIDGIVSAAIDGYNDTLAAIDQDRVELDERVSALTARLARKFTAMDIIVSQFKTTETFLKNQLAALNGGSGDD